MTLINPDHKKHKRRKPLKKSKLGFEIEFHLIDNKGRIQNRAPEVIETVKKINKDIPIIKECGNNFIELNSYPGVKTYNPALDLANSIEATQEAIEKLGLMIYPFGTYPIDFQTDFSYSPHYKLKKKIIGLDRFKIAPHSAGFHCHYTLPKGVFDEKTKNLRLMISSKLGRSLVNSYNFCIAMDPAMILFAQSSPFFRGTYISKDMKNLIYRGGKKLRYEKGVYTNLQMFGNLPPYKQTMTDLMAIIKTRWLRWSKLAKKANPKIDINKIYSTPLDLCWCPVKINKVGTIEQRGMDTNLMSISFAIAVLFKFCLRKIQREFIEVIPTDFGIREPFKLEDGILFIPPQTYVRDKLQSWSIYKGYGKKEMYFYAKRFFNFAKSVTPKKYNKLIKPISEMIESKESMSDKILKYARRKDYLTNGKIGKKDACELSLYYAKKFSDDFKKVEENLNLIKYSII